VALALGVGTPDDLRSALAGGPALAPLWIWDAQELLEADPALRAELLPGFFAVAAGPSQAPADTAEVFALLAETAPGEAERRGLWAISAALLRAALVGDPARDRAHWTSLAEALEGAGDRTAAIAVLDEARRAYPGEFTFHHALARLYLGQGRFSEAEGPAREAWRGALGDQRLRAAKDLAEALVGLGRREEALAALDAALAEAARPDPALQVRTHRYLQELEALRAGIATPAP
jgi:tetratricopeptide (TPR) repeat protein